MGSHVWTGLCPCCNFKEMIISSFDGVYFKAICPICGYKRWTEEMVPDNSDIELAKRELAIMGAKEKQKVVKQYNQDNIPFVVRLRDKG